MVRLAVMGVGRIGGEVAYLAAARGISDDLVLCDSVGPLLLAQALDLSHTGLDLAISTDKKEIPDADICIFSAGVPRNPSVKTRADLLDVNLPAARECSRLLKNFSGILITVTNPMDALNYFFSCTTGLDRSRCIGFGGQLDSARFTLELKKRGVTAFGSVLGEHGEHQVPVFSTLPAGFSSGTRDEILGRLRGSSMEVIKGKGGTVFGPAFHITELVKSIANDTRALTVCSSVLDGEYGLTGCSLGVPARVGKDGIRAIEEWKLDPWEQEKMAEAGKFVAGLCRRAVT
jgi:malate dehydrogenase